MYKILGAPKYTGSGARLEYVRNHLAAEYQPPIYKLK